MDQTALFKLSYGLYVVGVKNGDSFGGCIVDAMMQVTSDMPPLLMLGSMRNNLTNQLIRKTGELTISVLRADADPFLIANFGFQSARKVEKWENVEYAVKDGLPVLLDAASYLRCRVLEAKDLSTHTVYTCEVTDAWNGDGEPLLYSDYQKHMKDARPIIIAPSTNDGLSGSAPALGQLLQRRSYYFVPFGQDDSYKKPCSLKSDFTLLPDTLEAALRGVQIQPLLL